MPKAVGLATNILSIWVRFILVEYYSEEFHLLKINKQPTVKGALNYFNSFLINHLKQIRISLK